MYTGDVILPLLTQQQQRFAGKDIPKKIEKKSICSKRLSLTLLRLDNSIVDSYTSNNASSTDDVDIESEGSRNITRYLDFFKLAVEIDLLGPFDKIIDRVRAILVLSERCLLSEHIRSAADLPIGHTIRKFFAQACLKSYVIDINSYHPGKEFRFMAELDGIESFAADLLYEFNQAMHKGHLKPCEGGRFYLFKDPLTGTTQQYDRGPGQEA
jgi:hypothetical protein